MSKRSEGLQAEQLDNRWMYTSSQTNATLTAQVVGTPNSSKETRHMDAFFFSVLNKNSVQATITAFVRDVSVAGTILAQFPVLAGASSTFAVSMSDIHLIATPGQGFFVTTDTVQPSVTATVNAAGWTDSSQA